MLTWIIVLIVLVIIAWLLFRKHPNKNGKMSGTNNMNMSSSESSMPKQDMSKDNSRMPGSN